ncbi:MAG: glycosyltransferase, partial [Rubrivivax sp.]
RGMPLVATIHDTAAAQDGGDQWLSRFDQRLAQLVERRLYRLGYDHVLTVSTAVRDDLVQRFGLRAERVSAVPNGVDLVAIAATPPDPQAADLVFVGRLIPHKHPADLLQAAAVLNRQRQQQGLPPLRLKLVGGGPLDSTLRQQAQALGLAAHVLHWGEVAAHDEVIAHLKSAQLLVLPSTREGFGLVLAEAMAAGTAVLAYDIAAVRETLGTELAELLVPAGDVQALAAKLQLLLADADRRAALVATGQSRVAAHFDLRQFAQRVVAVYRQIMAARSGGN